MSTAFTLARWFQAPIDASGADEAIDEDGMDTRERILNDLHRATAVGEHDDGTLLAVTPTGAAMIWPEADGLVVFDYVRSDCWGRTRFWMNASSVTRLLEHLRTVPREPFDYLFTGTRPSR